MVGVGPAAFYTAKSLRKTKHTEQDNEYGRWTIDDENNTSTYQLFNLKKGYYEINVTVIDGERDDCGSLDQSTPFSSLPVEPQ